MELSELPKLREQSAKAERKRQISMTRERTRLATHVDDLEKHIQHLLQENAKMQAELEFANQTAIKASSLKRCMSAQNLNMLTSENSRQNHALDGFKRENDDLRKQLMSSRTKFDAACIARDNARAALEKTTKEVRRLREESLKMDSGGVGMDSGTGGQSSSVTTANAVGAAMHTLTKRRLLEKEQEVSALRQKLRRMLILEKKSQTQTNILDQERSRYETELKALRCRLNESNDKIARLGQALTVNGSGAATIGLQVLAASQGMRPKSAGGKF